MMRDLVLYENYTREEVHGIFSPDTVFTPQAGTWGLHGIISIPERPNDFVFFITFGKTQGEHVFEEGVTEEGVLVWQSQPRQGLKDSKVTQFINHDDLTDTIYLFLRTNRNKSYTYLGTLKYLSHDIEREYPVYFQWQIKAWKPPVGVLEQMGLRLQPRIEISQRVDDRSIKKHSLKRRNPPKYKPKLGETTKSFKTRKAPDYSEQDARNRKLGLAGEKLVVKFEVQKLIEAGRWELAEKVRHTSVIEGDGAGYDIESYESDGSVKYIEVKTTRGAASTPFYMSVNEVAASKLHSASYSLYRVYDFDMDNDVGSFYEIRGDVKENYEMIPIQYRMSGPVNE